MYLMTLYAVVQEVGLWLLTLYAEEKVWVLLLGAVLKAVSLIVGGGTLRAFVYTCGSK